MKKGFKKITAFLLAFAIIWGIGVPPALADTEGEPSPTEITEPADPIEEVPVEEEKEDDTSPEVIDDSVIIQPIDVSVESTTALATKIKEVTVLADKVEKGSVLPVNILIRNQSDKTIENATLELLNVTEADDFILGDNEADAFKKTIAPGKEALYTINLVAAKDYPGSTYSLKYKINYGDACIQGVTPMQILSTKNLTNLKFVPGLQELLDSVKSGIISLTQEENALLKEILETLRTGIQPANPSETPQVPNYPTEVPNMPTSSNNMITEIPSTPGPSITGGEDVKNKPKLIISNYLLSPKMPQAGQEFTMSLTFYNTNAKKSVNNIKIFLTSDTPAASATGAQVGGSVFSPVNSSNTFYIAKIAPQKTVSKDITLAVMPNASAQNYSMVANFEYEDANGNQYTAQELIGIPVVQVAKILVGDVITQTDMAVGMSGAVDLDFYNTGKDTLSNLMVTIEGDGFVADNQRYFVGNFAPGSSDHFSTGITPAQPGELSGKIVITYEDSTGTPQSIEKPFTSFVMENMMPVEGEMPPEDMPTQNQSPLGSPLLWIVLLAAIIAGVLIIRKKRKAKKDEEDLTIDE